MPNIKQGDDGGLGIEGVDAGKGSGLLSTLNYSAPATSTALMLFYTTRTFILDVIEGRTTVAGTGGACTASFYIAPSGTAPASGTKVHSSGSFNLVGTVNTDQMITLTTTVIPPEYALYVVFTGTATNATGGITVMGRRA
jgi:hypothetical protein